MLLRSSQHAAILQAASKELEKVAILSRGRQVARVARRPRGGQALLERTPRPSLPKKSPAPIPAEPSTAAARAESAAALPVAKEAPWIDRGAMITEPMIPAGTVARREAFEASKASRIPQRPAAGPAAGTAGGRPPAAPPPAAVEGTEVIPQALLRPPPSAPVGRPMAQAEQVAGTAVRPAPTLPPEMVQAGRTPVPAAAAGAAPVAQAAEPTSRMRQVIPVAALGGGGGATAYGVSDTGGSGFPKAAALYSLGEDRLAALAMALDQEKEAGLFRAIGGAITTGAKGLRAGGTIGARSRAAATGTGFLKHRLQTGARAAKTGWRRGMDPWAAKAKTLGSGPAASAAAKPAAAAAKPAASAATSAPARRGPGIGTGLVAGTGVGVAGIMGAQGAMSGRSAQLVGVAPPRMGR